MPNQRNTYEILYLIYDTNEKKKKKNMVIYTCLLFKGRAYRVCSKYTYGRKVTDIWVFLNVYGQHRDN